MESSFHTLSELAEILMAFVAFAAIVASLRVSFGAALTDFQRLLVQFFTVTGMGGVSVLMLPLVIAEFWDDEQRIALYSILYALIISGVYLVVYLRQRFRIKAPTPLVSAFVMTGYAFWLPTLALIAGGVIFQTSLGVVAAFGFWVLLSAWAIFVYFLYEFIHSEEPKS
jgi:hypothetical protein